MLLGFWLLYYLTANLTLLLWGHTVAHIPVGGGNCFPTVNNASNSINVCIIAKLLIIARVVEILVLCGLYLIFNHIFRMFSMMS